METENPRIPLKWLWTALCVLAVSAALGAALAKPAYYLWYDLTFFWTERTEAEVRVWEYAREQGIPAALYPESMTDLLERNPETEVFVFGYPFRQPADPDLSAFSREEVPLFLQWDPQWGYEIYGSDVIGITGCGPTCLAMAGYYLTGEDFWSPDQVAAYALEAGYYVSGQGSAWTLMSEGAVDLGLRAEELPLDEERICQALEAGNPVILAMGPGDFTSAGHFILLSGLEDGLFQVRDPNSILRSYTLWSYETLKPQIRNIWEISLPEDP